MGKSREGLWLLSRRFGNGLGRALFLGIFHHLEQQVLGVEACVCEKGTVVGPSPLNS